MGITGIMPMNVDELTDNHLNQFMASLRKPRENVFTSAYRKNGFLIKKITDKLLDYNRSFDNKYFQFENYLRIIDHSNTLTVNDINEIIKIIASNSEIINTIEFADAIKENYPEFSEEVNYIPLVDKMMDFLASSFYYADTVKWMNFNDNVGKYLAEYFIMNGFINDFVYEIDSVDDKSRNKSNTDYLLLRGKQQLLRKFKCNGNKLAADDFINYYGLNKDLLLGVMI